MKIEFKLPQGAGGAAAGTALDRLRRQLNAWCYAHMTTYKSRVTDHTLTVELAREADYSLFAISWTPEKNLEPRIRP